MPFYCYKDENSEERIEKFFNSYKDKDKEEMVEDGKKFIYVDKKRYFRDIGVEKETMKTFSANWPQSCGACGVGIWQTKEAYEHSKQIGVPTEFDKKGKAIFRDRSHRRKYLKAINWRDNDAGYSD